MERTTQLPSTVRIGALLLVAGLAVGACADDTATSDATGPDVVDAPGGTDAGEPASSPATSVVEEVDVTAANELECPTEGEEWEVAKAYIEHNATDDDTGFHGFYGGEAWRELCLVGPNGDQLWLADPRGALGDLSVSDFFFESREPPGDEYSIDDLKADFPEGEYTVSGIDFEGVARVGTAVFTHDIPAEPQIVSPPLGGDPEEEPPPVVSRDGLVVEWEPVTETIDGAPVEITGYEVIVTDEEVDDPEGWARPLYDVHVPGDQTSLPVPTEFLQPDRLYELEVLAIEDSGNQTISVGFFRTG